jgi:excisionase family DNA binding protein
VTTPKDRPGPSSTQDGDRPAVLAQRGGEMVAFLLTVEEAAARLSIGRTLMYELISTGAVESVTIGRLRRVRPIDLETFVAGLCPAPIAPAPRRLRVVA